MSVYSTTIYRSDLDALEDEGWTIGAYWSVPGAEGYYLQSPDGDWYRIRISPSRDDSLAELEDYDNYTDALILGRDVVPINDDDDDDDDDDE